MSIRVGTLSDGIIGIYIGSLLMWEVIADAIVKIITSGARSAGRVLRGLVEKSKYERSGPTPPDTTRHDKTTQRF